MMDWTIWTMPAARATRALAVVAVCAALAVGGCRRPQARTVPEMPALEVPPPPPRLVEAAAGTAAPQPIPLIEVPTTTAPEPPRAAPPTPPRDAVKVDPPKPDPTQGPVKPPEETRSPATTLQTTTADREGELERRVRASLKTAADVLNRVDYRKLNADVQLQYDTAKSFIRQAEDALKNKNLVFAQTMADKAVTLAGQLAPR
jgi:hypothetical protein